MGELINGRTPEQIRFNISECSRSNCLSECPYENQPIESCAEGLLSDALALIQCLEAERDAALAKVPKWISVEERLPENGNDVLCWYEYYRYGDYNRMYQTYGIGCCWDGTWCGDVSIGSRAKVLYWMPLLELPKEG